MNNNTPLGVITIISGELNGTQYFVADGQSMIIGRGKDSQIIMPNSYSHVSRHHCTIVYDGLNRKFYVADTSSTGVYNSAGHHLKSQGYVDDGTILWIGNQDCMIQLSVLTDYQVDHSPSDSGRSDGYGSFSDNVNDLSEGYNSGSENANVLSDRYSAGSEYIYDNSINNGNVRDRRDTSQGRRIIKENKTLTLTVILTALILVSVVSIGLVHRLNSSVSEFKNLVSKPTGDFIINNETVTVTEIDEEEKEKRDQQAKEQEEQRKKEEEEKKDQDVVDKVPAQGYYYSVLTEDEKKLYDAIGELAKHPDVSGNMVTYESNINPSSSEFQDFLNTSCNAYLYDHADAFWLYNNSKSHVYYEWYENSNIVYLSTDLYTDYKNDQEDFNNAVEKFMSDIDLSKSDSEIALEIHNKLIRLVTYDFDECDRLIDPLAHTAYAALVKNGKGESNYAVCDGYSQAYVHLLRQAGIEAAVIVGDAGESESDAGGHAWSVVCLDGDWYEVDSTWDDYKNDLETMSDDEKDYYGEMYEDDEFVDKMEHYLYNITTKEITNYTFDSSYYSYTFKDGRTEGYMGSSIHYRAEDRNIFGADAILMDRAPIAKGTKYRYH